MTCELVDGSIFLHVPKTGGTWTYHILSQLKLIRRPAGRNVGGHSDYTRAVFFPKNKPRWRDWSDPRNLTFKNVMESGRHAALPFTFCFVRHPVSWYESSWRFFPTVPEAKRAMWVNVEGYIKRWHPFRVGCLCLHADFNEYVRNLLKMFPGYVTWIYSQFAAPEINFVGKQEHLRDDLLTVLRQRKFNIDKELLDRAPNVNASKTELPIRWDPGLLREVQSVERASLLRFGYSHYEEPCSALRGQAPGCEPHRPGRGCP